MTIPVADDYAAIAERMRAIKDARPAPGAFDCLLCGDTGWSSLHWDPIDGVGLGALVPTHPCPKCGNPNNLPGPKVQVDGP